MAIGLSVVWCIYTFVTRVKHDLLAERLFAASLLKSTYVEGKMKRMRGKSKTTTGEYFPMVFAALQTFHQF